MRQVILYGALLSASLVGSYWMWTHPSDEVEVAEGKVVLVQATEAKLSEVAWDADKLKLSITKKNDALGDYFWIEATETKVINPPKETPKPEETEGEAAEGEDVGPELPEPEPVEETNQVAFLANAEGGKLWADFAPLTAIRELSGGDDTTMGFDDPTATVKVVAAGKTSEITIGGETYGSKDRYARLDGKTYLLDDATLRKLQYATTRLMERALHPLKSNEQELVQVSANNAAVDLEHRNKDDRDAQFWARTETRDDADDAATTWLGKLSRTKIKSYNADPSVITTPPVASVLLKGNGAQYRIEFFVNGEDYYARSTFNRTIVQLTASTARDLLDDLEWVAE